MRLRLALFLACCIFSSAFGADGAARERREDFDAMWRAVDGHYAYFEGSARTRWRAARDRWRSKAAAARSRDELIAALEGALADLHDEHASVAERTPRSPRRVPQETDMWAAWREGRAVIEAVRYASDADVAGVHPGDIVTQVQGAPVDRAVREWLHANDPAPQDLDWALRHVLAGPRQGAFTLDLGGRQPRRAEIERNGRHAASTPAVMSRRIGEQRDIGYVRVRDLGDPRVVEQLDAALEAIADTRAWIVDLREANAGPRPATVAILSRFAPREAPWQIREGRDGKRDADRVVPAKGRPFRGPLVVLADRWTAGEAEALVAGLVSTAGARFVGTPMAGLRGELASVRLPHSGLTVRFPAEKTFLPDGTPRESLRPAVEVDLAAPNGGPGDPILYQALKLLEKN